MRSIATVDVKDMNSSRAALDVFTFYGAADATYANETSKGGRFTNAFIQNMVNPDQTLDELSQLIRSELTMGSSDVGMVEGARVEVTQEFSSINSTPQRIYVGTRGKIRSLDETDNSIEVEFSGYAQTQWVAQKDASSMQPDEEVQISPSENFLRYEYSGWTFFASSPPCCGLMPTFVENALVRLVRQRTCSKIRSEPVGETTGNRSVGATWNEVAATEADASLEELLEEQAAFAGEGSVATVPNGTSVSLEPIMHVDSDSSEIQVTSLDLGDTEMYDKVNAGATSPVCDKSRGQKGSRIDRTQALDIVVAEAGVVVARASTNRTQVFGQDEPQSI